MLFSGCSHPLSAPHPLSQIWRHCLPLLLPGYSTRACPYGENPARTGRHTKAPDKDANLFISLHYFMQNTKQLLCCWEVPAPPPSESTSSAFHGTSQERRELVLEITVRDCPKKEKEKVWKPPLLTPTFIFFIGEQVWEGEGVAHSTFPIVRQCEKAAKFLIQQWPIYLQAEMEISLDTVKHPKTFIFFFSFSHSLGAHKPYLVKALFSPAPSDLCWVCTLQCFFLPEKSVVLKKSVTPK